MTWKNPPKKATKQLHGDDVTADIMENRPYVMSFRRKPEDIPLRYRGKLLNYYFMQRLVFEHQNLNNRCIASPWSRETKYVRIDNSIKMYWYFGLIFQKILGRHFEFFSWKYQHLPHKISPTLDIWRKPFKKKCKISSVTV